MRDAILSVFRAGSLSLLYGNAVRKVDPRSFFGITSLIHIATKSIIKQLNSKLLVTK